MKLNLEKEINKIDLIKLMNESQDIQRSIDDILVIGFHGNNLFIKHKDEFFIFEFDQQFTLRLLKLRNHKSYKMVLWEQNNSLFYVM